VSEFSLSQAILAPLDAVFKAQLHAARSFLNMLVQLGYPHWPVNTEGQPMTLGVGDRAVTARPYLVELPLDCVQGEREGRCLVAPALALVPIAPLAVKTAEFHFDLTVKDTREHEQTQAAETSATEKEKSSGFHPGRRPWYLVSRPISVRGTFAPPVSDASNAEARIGVKVTVGTVAMPAALERALTVLTQTIAIRPGEPVSGHVNENAPTS